jgi:hypothetical protein
VGAVEAKPHPSLANQPQGVCLQGDTRTEDNCPSEDQHADIGTKELAPPLFNRHVPVLLGEIKPTRCRLFSWV